MINIVILRVLYKKGVFLFMFYVYCSLVEFFCLLVFLRNLGWRSLYYKRIFGVDWGRWYCYMLVGYWRFIYMEYIILVNTFLFRVSYWVIFVFRSRKNILRIKVEKYLVNMLIIIIKWIVFININFCFKIFSKLIYKNCIC